MLSSKGCAEGPDHHTTQLAGEINCDCGIVIFTGSLCVAVCGVSWHSLTIDWRQLSFFSSLMRLAAEPFSSKAPQEHSDSPIAACRVLHIPRTPLMGEAISKITLACCAALMCDHTGSKRSKKIPPLTAHRLYCPGLTVWAATGLHNQRV